MINVKVSVLNATGLHARPAGMITKEATKFKSNIELEYNAKRVNAKSIMSVMALGIGKGAEVTLYADGEDEETALNTIASLFNNGFGEL